ncbi:MAG: TIGR02147 family protein [Myxococcales bacterium]|nr:TIGR02147 family protein [Myxococcales bacterium]
MAAPESPDVFTFLDYRAYLRAYYDYQKGRRAFSFRAFSRRAGLKSPNYLKLVMDGERNLSEEMAPRFAKACGLADEAERYFVLLVAFNQARTVEERNRCYSRLRRHRRFREAHKLDGAQDMYHSRWYLPAIRELSAADGFTDDPRWIARRLLPPISPKDAKTALDTLLELGLLERGDDGHLEQAEPTVSTGPEVRSLHLANFHRTMMEHAKGSIDRVAAGERDISSLTLCLGEDGLERIKRAIQRFRKELLEIEDLEAEPRQVVQVNFQLFPLSTLDEPDPKS